MSEILTVGTEACVELFAAYGVRLEPRADAPEADADCHGMIGFVGDGIRGTLLLSPSLAIVERSKPIEACDWRDWVGELTNQVMGCIQRRLFAYGAIVQITTPLVIRGLRISPVSAIAPVQLVCSEGGGLEMWIDAEIERELVQGEGRGPAALDGGDLLLF